MSYQITLTNGSVLTNIPENSVDHTTSLSLIGKNFLAYGTAIADNFVRLLESGANATSPVAPLVGQQWFDTTNKILKVWTGTAWASVGAGVTSIAGLTGSVSLVQLTSAGIAVLASPVFTGVPQAQTAALHTNTNQLATTSFVMNEVNGISLGVVSVAGLTGTVTLAQLQTAGLAALANPTFTGTPRAPTAAANTNTTQIATTAFVITQLASISSAVISVAGITGAVTLAQLVTAGVAPLASPTMTGIPRSTTAAAGTNTTQIATTAFVTTAVTSALTVPAVTISGNGEDALTVTGGGKFGSGSRFFRFGYGATTPLVRMQSAGTDAAGSNRQVLQITQQIDLATGGASGAYGALESGVTVSGSPSTDYWGIGARCYVTNLRDLNPPAGGSQHGALFTHAVRTLANVPGGTIPSGRRMAEIWGHWMVLQDETGLPSSTGNAMVGTEVDIIGNSRDDSQTRFVRQAVLSTFVKDATKQFEFRYGDYWNSHTGGAEDTFFNSVIALYAGYTIAGLDMSQGTQERSNPYIDTVNRATAIRLRDGLKISFNGDGATGAYLTHNSASLEWWTAGVRRFRITDTGQIWLNTFNELLFDTVGGTKLISDGSVISITGKVNIKGNVGFNDSGAQTKQTVVGNHGGLTALANLLAALANYGLITNNTTA